MNGSVGEFRRSASQFQAQATERIAVRIGDVRVASGERVLYTIGLGSCVAIALYDARARVGGLAHAMLPEARPGRSQLPPGRFVVSAVGELVRLMEQEGAMRRRMRARLAGGASMFQAVLDRDGLHLGRRNVDAARDALRAIGVPLDAEDVLGTWGRSVYLRIADGSVLVTSVTADDVVL